MRAVRILVFCLALGGLPQSSLCAASDMVSPSSSVAQDGPVKLRVSLDKSTARVAEPIRLVLEVEAPRGSRVELPPLGKGVGEFEIRKSDRVNDLPSENNAAIRRWILSAVLETLKTGDLKIPAIEVQYATDPHATTLKSLASMPLEIHVASVLEDRADPRKFRDIAGTVDVAIPKPSSQAWLWWTVATAGAIVVAGLVAVAIRKRRVGQRPNEWALKEIADLEAVRIESSDDAVAVFNELVRVIRDFFELEFDVPIASSTSREFLKAATSQVGLSELSRKRLAWLASLDDEIKFAKLSVGEPRVREAIEHAKTFVSECDAHRRATARGAA